jgi:TonB-dependent SusC/RagA subfamily outer membrane receptor
MESVAIYLFKYSIWICLFWLIYWFFFRKETFFGFNRVFLLCGLALSFALASCRYHYSVMLNLPLAAFTENSPVQEVQSGFTVHWLLIIMGIYFVGVFVLLLHHLNGLNKIRNIIRKQHTQRRTNPPVIEVAEIQSSFSFFGYIFMDKSVRLSEVERQLILEHETAHIKQCHWMDLLFAQIVCILQWFNPFAWLYLRAMKENHEFLADRSVLRKGNSPAVYHATLINCALKTPVFALTSSFTYYNNKFKRIIMMKKNASKSTKKFAVLLLFPACAVFLLAFAKPEYSYLTTPAEQDKIVTKDSVMVITADTLSFNKAPFVVRMFDSEKDTLVHINGKGELSDITYKGKDEQSDVVYYVDGKAVSSVKNLNANDIHSMNISKSNVMSTCEEDTTPKYRYYTKGVISIITKKHARETGIESENKDATLTGKAKEKNDNRFIFKGENPLIIVDGEEYSGDIENFEDANKIESVTVLKDATAIVRYGEKGKNGAIIITTKAASEAKIKN